MSLPPQKFNKNKALHALLYVISRLPQPANVYNVLKCIWFADRAHLAQFGRQIYGETYFAPAHGPVPSRAYDIIKYASGRPPWELHWPEVLEALTATTTHVTAKIDPDLDELSRSEMICLTHAAKKYGQLPFTKLKTLSHQSKAFRKADNNGEISFDALVSELDSDDGSGLTDHLVDRHPGSAQLPPAKKRKIA